MTIVELLLLATPARVPKVARQVGETAAKTTRKLTAMNEQQTQVLLAGMIKLMGKIASVMANHESRIKDVEEDESAENLEAFELIPLTQAMSAQLNDAYPVQPTV